MYKLAAEARPDVRAGVDPVAAVSIVASFALAEKLDDAADLLEVIALNTDGKLTRAHFERLPANARLDPELDPEIRAAFLLAAASRETDSVVRQRLLSDVRLYDSLGRVAPR